MLHRIIAVLIRMIYDIMSPIIVEGIYPDYWEFRKVAQKKNSKFFTLINSRYCLSKGCYLALDTKIESNPILPHGLRGIFISKNATIGRNVTIFQQVTIGSNNIPGHKKMDLPK